MNATTVSHIDGVQIRQAHVCLWQCRDRLGDRWPTPSTPLKALRFVYQEAGEGLDALARRDPDNYVRNNDRNMNEADEWADTAFMLLTFLGPGELHDLPTVYYREFPNADLGATRADLLAVQVARVMDEYLQHPYKHVARFQAYIALEEIRQYIEALTGKSLPQIIAERLQRIERKVTSGGA